MKFTVMELKTRRLLGVYFTCIPTTVPAPRGVNSQTESRPTDPVSNRQYLGDYEDQNDHEPADEALLVGDRKDDRILVHLTPVRE